MSRAPRRGRRPRRTQLRYRTFQCPPDRSCTYRRSVAPLALAGDLPSTQTCALSSPGRSAGGFSPRRDSHWDRQRCSSHRYPSPSPARYCRPSPIAGRPGPDTAHPSRLTRPAMYPRDRIGRSQRVRASAPSAPGRPSPPAGSPPAVRPVHQGGIPSAYSGRQQMAQLRETDWAIPIPASGRPNTGPPRLSARPRGGSPLAPVDLPYGVDPATGGRTSIAIFRATSHRSDTPGAALGIVSRHIGCRRRRAAF